MERKTSFYVSVLLFSFILAYLIPASYVQGQTQSGYNVEVAFPQLVFNQPVGIVNSDDGSSRLFVVEQAGVVRVFEKSQNASNAQVFLDISNKVLFSGEQGLLGLAFHPNYTANGYFYLDYVTANPTRTIISRYTVNPNNPNQANPGSEFVLLEIAQPFSNHKGGQLAFGPDGYLYVGMGDGGSEGDPLGNGQSRSTLLGKIIRIDVSRSSAGKNYTVPFDNPFVGNALGYREEIFAYGLRNPWRFSFDVATGQLWAGDVGQDRIEEVDVIEKGKNYGWNIMEGTLCFNPPTGCNQTGLELPVYEYNHTLGNAIIGGFVYRGSALPDLQGRYIYGDYGSGRIWALSTNNTTPPVNTMLADSNLLISSFGVDQTNELYFCAFDGKIYRLISVVVPEFAALSTVAILVVALLLTSIIVKKLWLTSPSCG